MKTFCIQYGGLNSTNNWAEYKKTGIPTREEAERISDELISEGYVVGEIGEEGVGI